MSAGASEMSEQQLQQQRQYTEGLVKAAAEDDLIFLLYWLDLLLKADGSVDAPSPVSGRTALQAAVLTTGRWQIRKVIIEVLLLAGARRGLMCALARQEGNSRAADLLESWESTGRDEAQLASELLQLTPHEAEPRVWQEGLSLPDEAEEQQPGASISTVQDPAQDDDVDMEVNSAVETETIVSKAETSPPRALEPLKSTTSPSPKDNLDTPSPSPPPPPQGTTAPPPRASSPFVPHKLCISNIAASMSESELVEILERVGGRIGNSRILTTNSTPPTQTAYIDVGSAAARERIRETWDGTHVNGRALAVHLVDVEWKREPALRGRARAMEGGSEPMQESRRDRSRGLERSPPPPRARLRSRSRSRMSAQGSQGGRSDWRRPSERSRSPPRRRRTHSPLPRGRSRSPRRGRSRSPSRHSALSSIRRSPPPYPRRRSLSPRRPLRQDTVPPRRRSPTPPRRPASPLKRQPSPATVPPVFLAGIPPSMAERQIYDLASSIVPVQTLRVRLSKGNESRFAFVNVSSDKDAQHLVRHFPKVPGAPDMYAERKWIQAPHLDREWPYRSPELNLQPPADHLPPEVYISHLPTHATTRDITLLLGTARLRPHQVLQKARSGVAFVELASLAECAEAIRQLDGKLVHGHAICVEWCIPRELSYLTADLPSVQGSSAPSVVPPHYPSPSLSTRPPDPDRQPRQLPRLSQRRDASPPHSRTSSPAPRARPRRPVTFYDPARISVTRMSDGVAERQLYDLIIPLADIEDIKVLHRSSSRFAFVDLRAHEDVPQVIEAIDDARIEGAGRITVERYRLGPGELSRPLHEDPRHVYQGAWRNSRPPPGCQQNPRIRFQHVAQEATEHDLRSALQELGVSAGTIKVVPHEGREGWKNRPHTAYVDLTSEEDGTAAIRTADGLVLRGSAMTVNWLPDAAKPAPPRNNPTRRASSIGPSRATKPTPSSKAPHHSPSATSSYVPTTTPVHGTESVDVSRLETLDLSLADVQRVQQIWAPLPQPPTDKFTRTIDVDVSFGGLSAPEARAALKLGPAFSDPEQQARYETFLHSQAGDSSDHYLVFLAQLANFKASNLAYARFARRAARSASSPSPEPIQYTPVPESDEYMVQPSLCAPTSAPPTEQDRRRPLEVSKRVARAFGVKISV